MISCAYCRGAHERPAEVKQCWADHQGAELSSPAGMVSETPATPPVSAELQQVPLRRGPTVLGRNVIVSEGAPAPAEWVDAERVVIDAAAIVDPADVVTLMRRSSHSASALVIELIVDFEARPAESNTTSAYELGVGYEFLLDDLHWLVWSNSIDARGPVARWNALDAAVALGASVGGEADVVLPDASEVWVDGGPIRHIDPVDGASVLHVVQLEQGCLTPSGANETSSELAPDQLAAVTHAGGSARIIAPAGSGKTRVLTERARHLVKGWRLPVGSVCLVAFNKRAQQEMVARTSDLQGLQVRTLNSIALAIINGRAPFASQTRQWRTIDERQVRGILGRFVTIPRRRNIDPIAPWIGALSLVRLGLVAPAEVEARYGGDVDGLADVWPQYAAALESEGAVDFDHQIWSAIQVLLAQPEARRAAQRSCRIMLVDEFQDLTPAHLLLVRLLSGAGGAVFGVGDDDQTIYGYNGADPGWLIDFTDWFPGSGDHPLEVNYRCPAGVVDVVDRLLRHNRRRVPKRIRAASTDPLGWCATSVADPVAESVAAVQGALSQGASPADVAVLTRVNAVIAPVQVALSMAGVAIAGGVGTEFADRTAIRAALAWLRLASGRRFTPADLSEALRRPSRPLHPRIAEWVGEQGDVASLVRLAGRLTNERDSDRVNEFAADITRLQSMAQSGAPTAQLIGAVLDDVGLGGAVATLDKHRQGMNRAAQGDDLVALRQLARLQPDSALFEAWLREFLAAPRSSDGVLLSTIHRVKGQEWRHVVVHLADDDQFPHRLSEDVEEERRLFHVALTRASHQVSVVSGTEPSPFISELTTEPGPDDAPVVEHRPKTLTKAKKDRPDHPLLDRSKVVAVPQMVLIDQGQEWLVVESGPDGVVAEHDGVTRKFAVGSKVATKGKQRGQLAAHDGVVSPECAHLFDLLRIFRDGARAGKPAYTVFDDKTLAAIASLVPADLAELAQVKGVGPAKLERFGSDVLALAAIAQQG